MKHSIVLKFNNVEMLKTMLKVLKTPAAGTCANSQNRLQRPRQFAQEKLKNLTSIEKRPEKRYNTSKAEESKKRKEST